MHMDAAKCIRGFTKTQMHLEATQKDPNAFRAHNESPNAFGLPKHPKHKSKCIWRGQIPK
jgi:hypothetical protein